MQIKSIIRIGLFFSVILILGACTGRKAYYLSPDAAPYTAYDLTREGLFSNNIEGPAFRNDTLFVVNFEHDGTIGMVFHDGHVEKYIDLPSGSTANSIKFDPAGNMYLADFTGHNILRITPSKKIDTFYHNDQFNQPNDIVMNKKGWIYASDPNWKDSTGRVWLIKDGEGQQVLEGIGTANGICLSPDEKYLYVGESVQLKIWRYEVGEDGTLSNKQLFTSFDDFDVDGMHFGPDGNLYACRYGKGVVAVFDPQGQLLREIPLKGKKDSNLVFGDPDGKSVFVTLQDRKGMEVFRIE